MQSLVYTLVWLRTMTASEAIGGQWVADKLLSVIVAHRRQQCSFETNRLWHQLIPIRNYDFITNGLHFICLFFGLECPTGLHNIPILLRPEDAQRCPRQLVYEGRPLLLKHHYEHIAIAIRGESASNGHLIHVIKS